MLCALALARTSALVALQVDRDGLREVVAEVANVFLCECLPCDDYTTSVYHLWDYKVTRTFEGLLDVDGILCASLEVGNPTLGLAESHGPLVGNLDGISEAAAHISRRPNSPSSCSPRSAFRVSRRRAISYT